MKTMISIAAVALPLFAQAVPITPPHYLIDIEYWGSVSGDVVGGGHSIGDNVRGTMRIDTRLAPGDVASIYDYWGDYQLNERCNHQNCPPELTEPSEFVTSPRIPDLGGFMFDRVQVFDNKTSGSANLYDAYDVEDWESNPGGSMFRRLNVAVSSTTLDFIAGDGLVQSFDVVPSEHAETVANGTWEQYVDNVAEGFSFVVDRIRVTPKLCKP
jgi:hypothetical protein